MLRKTTFLGAIALLSMALAGCQFYFEDGSGAGSDPGGWGSGWDCQTNDQCAPGCYCSDAGYCEEAGFCDDSTQCPEGWTCDDRNSCVPGGDQGSPCETDAECAEGSYCNADGVCEQTGVCTDETMCQDGQTCDPDRNTCVPSQPESFCQAEVTCTDVPPACDVGTSAEIVDGCYTGNCIDNADCSDAAACSQLVEDDCAARADCLKVFRGINCTDPNGLECDAADANCTCESFLYDHCSAANGG